MTRGLPEETIKPREIPPKRKTNNNSNNIGGSRASVLIASSTVYSPNAIAIYSSNPADATLYSAKELCKNNMQLALWGNYIVPFTMR
ncbi:MAG: hypothetical protein LBE76_00515 [Nitrososphaerota archaeon]|nr:hypothetical protein [Nitrososphaerota archaeon]